MGRIKPSRSRRIRPQDVETVEDLYAGLNQVAEQALDKLSGRLLAAGASPEDVAAHYDAVRAQAAMYVLQMDLMSFIDTRPDAGIQQIIFDELMKDINPVEALAIGLPDAEDNPTEEV
jgi:hypothetical protein